MPASALSASVRQWLTPGLRAAGWRKTGAHFRWVAHNGDQAVITFQRSSFSHDDTVCFYLAVGLCPGAWLFLARGVVPPGARSADEAMFRGRVRPAVAVDSVIGQMWSVDPGSVETTGAELAEVLARGLAPRLVELISDPEQLVPVAQASPPHADSMLPPGVDWFLGNEILNRLALCLTLGLPGEVEELLAEWERRYGRDEQLVARVRLWLASDGHPDHDPAESLEG